MGYPPMLWCYAEFCINTSPYSKYTCTCVVSTFLHQKDKDFPYMVYSFIMEMSQQCVFVCVCTMCACLSILLQFVQHFKKKKMSMTKMKVVFFCPCLPKSIFRTQILPFHSTLKHTLCCSHNPELLA